MKKTAKSSTPHAKPRRARFEDLLQPSLGRILDEELSDHMLLRAAFLEIWHEMRTVLLRFNQDFAPKPESERNGS